MTCVEVTEQLRQIVLSLLKLTVARPEAVTVQAVPCDKTTVLLVDVASEDLGKVIGRGGQLARSWRNLVLAVTQQNNCSVQIDFGDTASDKR